ncbi:MAG: TIGR03960 family B12-binding radical SAM protein [Desulfovibrio sp.]|nr:TIGR03960 family B12-binding radical SAM protein [Desulfovibrio sp.]
MRELLPLFPKPSRYAGIEDGVRRKNPADVRLTIALAFPDTYDVGMSYLGQKILYGVVNSRPHWLAERVMAPEREVAAVLRARNAPLCTLESDTPLAKTNCLAFSVTHELCYTNILYMLDLSGIPLRTADRPQCLTACPLVICGGGALLSAEPLAPFIDIMVLGDGEEALPDLLCLLEKALETDWPRRRMLEESRFIPGVYVPSFFADPADPGEPPIPLFADYTRPARRIVANLDDAPYPVRQITPVGAVHNRLSLEIARGCTRGCRFCHAGMVYRPARERAIPDILTLLRDCLTRTGFDEVSFLSLSAGDFSALKGLCLAALDRCAAEQISLCLPSLRVGSIDDEILERMADLRRTGITLAPEAGSQRLRDVINKGVTEEALLLHAQKLLEHGWRQVKLYFMFGLPTETDDDLAAIAELCRKVRDAAHGGPRMTVTAAIAPFVPKPFTPFQWEAQIPIEEMRRRTDLLRKLFTKQKCLKLRWHEPAMCLLEGILSRADRRMADVVEKAYKNGAIFCSWADNFDLAPWLDALGECALDARACTGPRVPGAPLPWSHLEAGVSEDFLLRERARALDPAGAKITGDCRYGACRRCGACDTGAAPSLLARADAKSIGNRLVLPQRDQFAHSPTLDDHGRLVCRTRPNRPPRIAVPLTVKAATYRVWHTKTAGSAFLSQLELQAMLDRALRRAGLPLAFSRGFHPLPLLSFGRALPVGVESLAEWFIVTLRAPLDPRDIADRLAVLPSGMKLVSVEQLSEAGRIKPAPAEKFRLRLAEGDPGAEARCFEDFAAQPAVTYMRKTKTGLRSVDIRPVLHCWSASIAPFRGESPQAGGSPAPAVTFVADWRMLYLSPLAFCCAVLAPLGTEAALRPRLRLVKTAQLYTGEDIRKASCKGA